MLVNSFVECPLNSSTAHTKNRRTPEHCLCTSWWRSCKWRSRFRPWSPETTCRQPSTPQSTVSWSSAWLVRLRHCHWRKILERDLFRCVPLRGSVQLLGGNTKLSENQRAARVSWNLQRAGLIRDPNKFEAIQTNAYSCDTIVVYAYIAVAYTYTCIVVTCLKHPVSWGALKLQHTFSLCLI